MKKVFDLSDEMLKENLKRSVEYKASEYFADDVMNRIFKQQVEGSYQLTWKERFLLKPSFRYALVGAFVLYPTLLRALV